LGNQNCLTADIIYHENWEITAYGTYISNLMGEPVDREIHSLLMGVTRVP